MFHAVLIDEDEKGYFIISSNHWLDNRDFKTLKTSLVAWGFDQISEAITFANNIMTRREKNEV